MNLVVGPVLAQVPYLLWNRKVIFVQLIHTNSIYMHAKWHISLKNRFSMSLNGMSSPCSVKIKNKIIAMFSSHWIHNYIFTRLIPARFSVNEDSFHSGACTYGLGYLRILKLEKRRTLVKPTLLIYDPSELRFLDSTKLCIPLTRTHITIFPNCWNAFRTSSTVASNVKSL